MIVQNTSVNGTTDISFTLPMADLPTSIKVCETVANDLGASGVMVMLGTSSCVTGGYDCRLLMRLLVSKGVNPCDALLFRTAWIGHGPGVPTPGRGP